MADGRISLESALALTIFLTGMLLITSAPTSSGFTLWLLLGFVHLCSTPFGTDGALLGGSNKRVGASLVVGLLVLRIPWSIMPIALLFVVLP